MKAHAPTCETLRGGDHGPCDCGYDAEIHARRHRIYTLDAILALVGRYGAERSRLHNGSDGEHAALLALRDAIEATVRQRDALREAVLASLDECGGADALGSCPRCARLRAALEVM